jgi:hypothetical protein
VKRPAAFSSAKNDAPGFCRHVWYSIEQCQLIFCEHLVENGSPGQSACLHTGTSITLASRGAVHGPQACYMLAWVIEGGALESTCPPPPPQTRSTRHSGCRPSPHIPHPLSSRRLSIRL